MADFVVADGANGGSMEPASARLLTIARFQRLAGVPSELKWFHNPVKGVKRPPVESNDGKMPALG